MDQNFTIPKATNDAQSLKLERYYIQNIHVHAPKLSGTNHNYADMDNLEKKSHPEESSGRRLLLFTTWPDDRLLDR